MDKTITRIFSIDEDTCEVVFRYDESFGKYFGDYPDFEETPKFTPHGKPWMTAMEGGCEHGQSQWQKDKECFDCGSCLYFKREKPGDLIGVCDNPKNKKSVSELKGGGF